MTPTYSPWWQTWARSDPAIWSYDAVRYNLNKDTDNLIDTDKVYR